MGAAIPILSALNAAGTAAPSAASTPTIPVWATYLPIEKTNIAYWAGRIQTAEAYPTGMGVMDIDPATIPTSEVPTGIIEDPSHAISQLDFEVQNEWQDYINGNIVSVFAGVRTDDPGTGRITPPGQGALFIYWGSVGLFPSSYYNTPMRSGAATIVAASGTLLTITTEGGDRLLFDVRRGQYLDMAGVALTKPLPTLPPAPTPTPTRAASYPVPEPTLTSLFRANSYPDPVPSVTFLPPVPRTP